MQRLFGSVLRSSFSKGLLSQLGCREANMGLHVWQRSYEGNKKHTAAFNTLLCVLKEKKSDNFLKLE